MAGIAQILFERFEVRRVRFGQFLVDSQKPVLLKRAAASSSQGRASLQGGRGSKKRELPKTGDI